MVNLVRVSYDWMKMAWARQPVLVLSCALAVIGKLRVLDVGGCVHKQHGVRHLEWSPILFTGPVFVAFSPGTAKGQEERRNWPTHYKRSMCQMLKNNPKYIKIYLDVFI